MALLDLWSLCHVATGLMMGFIAARAKLSPCAASVVVAIALVVWELVELLGHSRGWSWAVHDWWDHESWENRWLMDIGVGLLSAAGGYYAAQRASNASKNVTHFQLV